MTNPGNVTAQFVQSLDDSWAQTYPYPHWLLSDVFPDQTVDAIRNLPWPPARPPHEDSKGKRETHNSTRTFFTVDNRRRFPICEEVAAALQSKTAVRKIEKTCGINLHGSSLRIEYCQDTPGFWLEPHLDIPEKLFVMLVYLSSDPGSDSWGTEIYDQDKQLVATAPYRFNRGLIFLPSANSWHGFHKRPMDAVRKLIIVNYVRPEWRERGQLAYPDRPVD